MSQWDEVAARIIEILRPPRRLTDQEYREALARGLVSDFEQRARAADGDDAPTGVDAIQLRYYPAGQEPVNGAEGAANLRRVIRGILEP